MFEKKYVEFILEQASAKGNEHWNRFYLRVAIFLYNNESKK